MARLRNHLPLLLLLAAVTVGLRTPQIGDSLWLDEQHTAWTIRDGAGPLAARARMGNNSPLYFYLPLLSTRIFGWHEAALRLPSLLAGMGIPFAVYGLAFRWTKSRAASAAAALATAVDPNFLFYSLEARPYAILQLCSILQVASWIAWCHQPRSWRWWATCVATTILMFHLHYTSAILPVAEAILLVIWQLARGILRRNAEDDQQSLLWGAVLGGAVVLVGCTWPIWQIVDLYRRREAWHAFIHVPTLPDLVTVFPVLPTVGLAMALAGIAAGCYDWRQSERTRKVEQVWLLVVLLGILLAGLTTAWIFSRLDLVRIFYRRYLMALSVLPYLVTAVALALIPVRSWRNVAVFACCLFWLFWIAPPMSQWRPGGRPVPRSHEDWQAAVAYLRDCEPAPVFVRSGLIESDLLHTLAAHERTPEFREYCCLPLVGMYALPDWQWGPHPLPRTDAWNYLHRHDTSPSFWLIDRGPGIAPPQPFWREASRREFGTVTVCRMVAHHPPHGSASSR